MKKGSHNYYLYDDIENKIKLFLNVIPTPGAHMDGSPYDPPCSSEGAPVSPCRVLSRLAHKYVRE